MMPDDWNEQLKGVDALYFGAVGWPATELGMAIAERVAAN